MTQAQKQKNQACELKSSHPPCHRSPAEPSSGLSGRQLPGPRGTLWKRGFPHSRLHLERLLQLQAGVGGGEQKERSEQKD